MENSYSLRLQSWNGSEVLAEYQLPGDALPSFPNKTVFKVGGWSYTPLSYEYDMENKIVIAKIRNESDEWWNAPTTDEEEIVLDNGLVFRSAKKNIAYERWIDTVAS